MADLALATCVETYEPKPPGAVNRTWRKATHTCKLDAGHEPPHVCPLCGGSWREPGGPVTPADRP